MTESLEQFEGDTRCTVGLTDHRRGAPGCTGTSYLMIVLAGGSVPGTGTVHFARAIKGLRVKVHKWGDGAAALGWGEGFHAGCTRACVDDRGMEERMNEFMDG